ncbi:hypothetical protein BDQ17DRAFT_1426910 [Cyathus striatus]|nr:hypothetical protein BDQ17DRAFT_1426910 [Cyathus striatus]
MTIGAHQRKPTKEDRSPTKQPKFLGYHASTVQSQLSPASIDSVDSSTEDNLTSTPLPPPKSLADGDFNEGTAEDRPANVYEPITREDHTELSDYESESDDSDVEDEIALETALEHFMCTLAHAQQAAEQARQHLQKSHELAEKGYPSVASFFAKIKTNIQERNAQVAVDDSMKETEVVEQVSKHSGTGDIIVDEQEQMNLPEIHSNIDNSCETIGTDNGRPETPPIPIGNENPWKTVAKMLQGLCTGEMPVDNTGATATDKKLENWKDLPKIRQARAALSVKSKDKTLDVFFHACLVGMLGMLNLYLNENLSYTWHEASLITSHSQGHGEAHAQNICTWMYQYLDSNLNNLPHHRYSSIQSTILCNEDFSQAIQLHLQEKTKGGYICTQDIVDFVENSEEMQVKIEDMHIKKKTISLSSATCWLDMHGWCYSKKKNGMYVDGHECPDNVEYHDRFSTHWSGYEKRMYGLDNDGNIVYIPKGFPVPTGQCFHLILVTHD